MGGWEEGGRTYHFKTKGFFPPALQVGPGGVREPPVVGKDLPRSFLLLLFSSSSFVPPADDGVGEEGVVFVGMGGGLWERVGGWVGGRRR